jgi:hypothetical protein
MDDWMLAVGVIGLFIAIVPGALFLGIKIGSLSQATDGAHKRIDRLEKLLKDEFHQFRDALKDSVEQAWRNCPIAMTEHERRDK